MNKLFPLLLVLCIVVPSLSFSDATYKNGYFSGRSADIVVDDTNNGPLEVQLQWGLTFSEERVPEVLDVHLYNLISRSLGLPQIDSSLNSFYEYDVPFDFFSVPAGNIFFSFEGVTSKSFSSTPKPLFTYSLLQTSRPYHPMSALATVVTGTHPKTHGVVNERFSNSFVPNIFDVIKGMYGEDSVVVSGSSSKSFTEVLSTHHLTSSYYWNDETNSFVTIDSTDSMPLLSVSKVDFSSRLSSSLHQQLSFESNVVRVGNVVFNLENHADSSLFAEILFVQTASEKLSQSTATRKSLAFHFASLSKISSQYGESSRQWEVAVELVNSVVQNSLKMLDGFVSQLVYLPNYSTDRTKSMENLVTPIVSKYSEDSVFPQIVLTTEGQQRQMQLCEQINIALSDFSDVTVFCPLSKVHKKRDDGANKPVINSDGVISFHIVLWTVLLVLGIFIFSAYIIASIPPDEQLYTTSTLDRAPRRD